MPSRAIWVAQTGIFLALLIVVQIATRPFGNSILTGSLNNMLFILTLMVCGLSSAMILSAISPVIAFFMGMAPFWPFIPVIIAGNIVLVVLWHFIALRTPGTPIKPVAPVTPTASATPVASTASATPVAPITPVRSKNNERQRNRPPARHFIALACAAVAKFLILFFGIVHLVVPLVLSLGEPQASVVSAAFSYPQIITACIGGVLAMLLFPILKKALPK